MSKAHALFQLGMDLNQGSSTTQTEENKTAVQNVVKTTDSGTSNVVNLDDDRKDYFIERDGVRFAGTHLIIDLLGASRLDDLEFIQQTLIECVEKSKATLLHIHLHHFTPNGGVSGVAVLAESHISIHTWPEKGYAALDVFMCGDAEPHNAIAVLKEAFGPDKVVVDEFRRGKEVG
ncbi:adenosylmethionine decarboxylase [Kiloniella laminariae]|uniref:adenosylmethionine decarboxylase n=1 Tax=Kiloniella laminariae TaxID=454162 RepID=UPI0004763D8C|nr:adenosylmethionine decarboxylase [Kiloniella laminariae]